VNRVESNRAQAQRVVFETRSADSANESGDIVTAVSQLSTNNTVFLAHNVDFCLAPYCVIVGS